MFAVFLEVFLSRNEQKRKDCVARTFTMLVELFLRVRLRPLDTSRRLLLKKWTKEERTVGGYLWISVCLTCVRGRGDIYCFVCFRGSTFCKGGQTVFIAIRCDTTCVKKKRNK